TEDGDLFGRLAGRRDQAHRNGLVHPGDHEEVAGLVVVVHVRRRVTERRIDAVDVGVGWFGDVGIGRDARRAGHRVPPFRTTFDLWLATSYVHRTKGATLELWTIRIPETGTAEVQASRAEEAGWDGIAFTDSQNLIGDPYVAIALAARATERLRFATG